MLMTIGVIVLVVVNLYLYHKIFDVVYFDLGHGLLKELVGAFFAAALELAIIKMLGEKVLGGFLRILGGFFKIVVIIAGIIVAICVAYWLYKKIRKMIDKNTSEEYGNKFETEEKEEFGTEQNIMESGDMQTEIKATIFCANCGKEVSEDINFCNFCGKKMQ